MKQINRDRNRLANLKAVKQQLLNNAAISRADIARNINLHKSTISSLFTELDKEGYIKHLGRGKSTESGGRKPELYTINSHYGFIACFNITYAHLHTMFLYIDGQEISYQRIDVHNHDILTIMSLINHQLTIANKNNDTENGLLGISFSIHAVVDNNQIIHSPYYAMHSINLQQYFTDRYHVPVLIGNEANLAAIYERDYANRNNPANFIVLSIHRGPGIGVIANNQLFNGYQGMTGELGSVRIYNSQGKLQEIGDYISVDFLQQEISMAINRPAGLTYDEIHQLDCQGNNPQFYKVINNFADVVSHTLFNLRMLYGPEQIFINSSLVEAIPSLIITIKQKANQLGVNIPIKTIKGSRYVSLLGAAAVLIRKVLNLNGVNLHFQWSQKIG